MRTALRVAHHQTTPVCMSYFQVKKVLVLLTNYCEFNLRGMQAIDLYSWEPLWGGQGNNKLFLTISAKFRSFSISCLHLFSCFFLVFRLRPTIIVSDVFITVSLCDLKLKPRYLVYRHLTCEARASGALQPWK